MGVIVRQLDDSTYGAQYTLEQDRIICQVEIPKDTPQADRERIAKRRALSDLQQLVDALISDLVSPL